MQGVHSFDVTTVISNPPLITVPGPDPRMPYPVQVPATQTFTLVLDADRLVAFIGDSVYSLTRSGNATFTVQQMFGVGWDPSVYYEGARFTVDGDRLTGTASGSVSAAPDFEHWHTVSLGTVALTGEPDATPPAIRWSWSGPLNPLRQVSLNVSEPLPPTTVFRFQASTGEIVTYPRIAVYSAASSVETWEFATRFRNPVPALEYGKTYRLIVDGVVDFAGHQIAPFELTTLPVPPLVGDAGFEGAAFAVPGGEIVDGTTFPPIAGGKSLYLPIQRVGAPCSELVWSDLVLRLPVPIGGRALRFSFRTVSASSGGFPGRSFEVGPVGGVPIMRTFYGSAPFLPVTLANGDQAYMSVVDEVSVALPVDAAGEVIFAILGDCPRTYEDSGAIIDNLRIE